MILVRVRGREIRWLRTLVVITLLFAIGCDVYAVNPVTNSERRAGIEPVNLEYAWGDARRYGAIGDGVSDDTEALQAALHSRAPQVRFVKPSGFYRTRQLEFASDTHLIIDAGTVIKAMPGYSRNEVVFLIKDVEDVVVEGEGAVIDMGYERVNGEFRHGVSIRGSRSVRIDGLASNRSGGDGFYVGESILPFSENVVLTEVSADSNRRQGLSIVSAKSLRIEDSRFTRTSGTKPAAGIDIEPNNSRNELENISLTNVHTGHNDGSGITIELNRLSGSEEKLVSIDIVNAEDVGSRESFKVGKFDNKTGNVSGHVRFESPVSRDAGSMSYVVRNYDARGPQLEFQSPSAIRPNADGHRSAKWGSAFVVFRESKDRGATSIGNVFISNPVIVDDRENPQVVRYFFFRDLAFGKIDNVHINGVVSAEGISPTGKMIEFFGAGSVNDTGGVLRRELVNSNVLLGPSNYARTLSNHGSTRPLTVSLGDVPAGWPKVTIRVESSAPLSIRARSGQLVGSDSDIGNTSIRSDEVGASVTLQKIAAGKWLVSDVKGHWETLR